MAKPQKSTAQSEVPGLVKKGPLYYLKRDWQLYALMLLPMVFIIVFKYFAYTGLSVAFLDYKIGKGYAGSKFVGLKIFEKVFKHRDFTKAVINTLLLNVLDLIFSFPMPIILALLLNEIRVKWFDPDAALSAALLVLGRHWCCCLPDVCNAVRRCQCADCQCGQKPHSVPAGRWLVAVQLCADRRLADHGLGNHHLLSRYHERQF